MSNKVPSRSTSRDRVYEVLDGERDYQDEHFPTPPTLLEVADMLDEYAVKLISLYAPPASPEAPKLTVEERTAKALKRLREIGAIAIKGMELHGAVPRENHVPASAGIVGEMHATAKPDALTPFQRPDSIEPAVRMPDKG